MCEGQSRAMKTEKDKENIRHPFQIGTENMSFYQPLNVFFCTFWLFLMCVCVREGVRERRMLILWE